MIDPHTYAENFLPEDEVKRNARAVGEEMGATDATTGTGAYLKHLAHILSAQSVVEIGTGSGVGALWVLEGMMASGTLTSIDNEMEHSNAAKIALLDADIAAARFRLITNPAMEVVTKLADRAYDMVIFRHDPEDLPFAINEAHRILRSGGVFVIDNFFGDFSNRFFVNIEVLIQFLQLGSVFFSIYHVAAIYEFGFLFV